MKKDINKSNDNVFEMDEEALGNVTGGAVIIYGGHTNVYSNDMKKHYRTFNNDASLKSYLQENGANLASKVVKFCDDGGISVYDFGEEYSSFEW